MEKEFIPYELALLMKIYGFDEPCFGHFINKKFYLKSFDRQGDGITLRPTFSQAFRWFREKHGLYGIPEERALLNNFSYQVKSNKEGAITFIVYGGYPLNFKSYDEAETACLEKLIEIVEQKTFKPEE